MYFIVSRTSYELFFINPRPFEVIILSSFEYMLFLLPKMQYFQRYAKLDFVEFISFEINYFVGTGCFLFLRNIDTLLFQIQMLAFPSPFFSLLFLNVSLLLLQAWPLLLNILGLGRDKVYLVI